MASGSAGGDDTEEVKDFFGVYLLVSQSEESKFKGKTYIGYTVNPNRRITQHNRGTQAGGAKRTSNRGPWKMVLIVHNFPNSISALRFEWAWQQPSVSIRLKKISGLQKKRVRETHFQHKFRILAEMLRIGPWDRLPLKIRWLCEEYATEFPVSYLKKATVCVVKWPRSNLNELQEIAVDERRVRDEKVNRSDRVFDFCIISFYLLLTDK